MFGSNDDEDVQCFDLKADWSVFSFAMATGNSGSTGRTYELDRVSVQFTPQIPGNRCIIQIG